MSTRKLSALIENTAGLSALTRTMQRLAALQRLYVVCAPPDLARASRVVGDRDGMLVIAADNGAIATKLKQLVPRLLKKLQKQSAEVTGIRVQVQVNKVTPATAIRADPSPLPVDLIDNFDELSKQVKDPDLRAALARFAARRRKSG
jgi:hypothetical protein